MKVKKLLSCFLIAALVATLSVPTGIISNVKYAEAASSAGRSFSSTYPSEWYPLKNYSYVTSKKFKRASKAIILGLMAALFPIKSLTLTSYLEKVSAILIGGAGTEYFVDTDSQDVYFKVDYSYRELGKGKYSSNGSYIGNYEIKKVVTAYSNSKLTKKIGSSSTETKKDSIIEPTF